MVGQGWTGLGAAEREILYYVSKLFEPALTVAMAIMYYLYIYFAFNSYYQLPARWHGQQFMDLTSRAIPDMLCLDMEL